MKTIRAFTDKFAISLSLLCTIHCLLLPALLITLPSLAALHLDNEAFHFWMVVAVLPTSIYALTLGCKQHKRYGLLVLGIAGLISLTMAVMLGEETIGETGEKILTVLGSIMVATGHLLNYRSCQRQQRIDCDCSEPQKGTNP